MSVSKHAKICVTPNATPKCYNRWNIGRVGSPTQNSRIGHVDFMLFVLISFALVTQRAPSLQWNMGFSKWSLVRSDGVAVFKLKK